MKSEVTIGLLPVTKEIVVGRVNQKGLWVGNRTDVTNSAIVSVGDYLVATNQRMSFIGRDGETYIISVEKLNNEESKKQFEKEKELENA